LTKIFDFGILFVGEQNMNLYDLGNGTYGIMRETGTKPLTGSLKDVAALAMAFGVDLEEFEFALLTMNREGHKRANFGFNGTFLFSSEK
jgi:hypothetical protein